MELPLEIYISTSMAAATCGFKMVLFTANSGNNFVGGKCALPSALLVMSNFRFTNAYD